MMLKKPLFAASLVAALGAGSIVALPALADEKTSGAAVFQDLAETIAEHFNLDVDEVRSVMKSHHEEMRAERAAHEQERLDQLVEDGVLTSEQADAFAAKREEWKAFMESLKELTPDERREAMEEHRAEVEAWAKEQGIDLSIIFPRPPHQGQMRPLEVTE